MAKSVQICSNVYKITLHVKIYNINNRRNTSVTVYGEPGVAYDLAVEGHCSLVRTTLDRHNHTNNSCI